MIKKIFSLGIFFLPLLVDAQISINAQLPISGFIQKEQLWNLILINNNENAIDVNIRISIMDAATNQEAFTAISNNILLEKGVKVVTNSEVQPVLYNYNNQDFSRNYLPLGTYIICYKVSLIAEVQIPLAEDCIQLHIDPLSPPLLNSPTDKSETIKYPLFNWLPPAPSDLFSNLNYDFILTEVLEGQVPAEAIEFNVPIYSGNNIMQPYLNYPSSFTELDTNKTYAWQIIAKNGLSYSAKTEVWTFKVNNQINTVAELPSKNYLLMENDLTDTYQISGNVLYIKYASFDRDYTGQIVFTDINGEIEFSIDKQIVTGDNYFDLDINRHFQNKTIYNANITDLQGKKHVLTFSIQ
jgi:hypothetical protein